MVMKYRSFQMPLAHYWGNVSRLFLLLGLLSILFAIVWKQNKDKCKCPKGKEAGFVVANEQNTMNLDDIIWKKSQRSNVSVIENAMGPLPVQYTYLVGSPPLKKRFLTIGISSVHKVKEEYLLKTISSIFSHCSPEELQLITLVIYLANNNIQLNEQSAREIEAEFSAHINSGRLLVIESSLAGYPHLSTLEASHWGNEGKTGARAKQNVDYAYLVNFCAGLSDYYLMLEDDIVCATSFVAIIQRYVRQREAPWTTIAFSRLGSIGKLYHSSDLYKLARFLLLFYDAMPADWLLEAFHQSQAQEHAIMFRPSLFQHIGRVSSFHSMETQFKDPEFEEDNGDLGDFPLASCFTNIPNFSNYMPSDVCPPGRGVFWGKNITSKSFFTVVFAHPIVPQKIQIHTGSAEYNQDILYDGYVEKGRLKVHSHDGQTCLTFQRTGVFKDGFFEMEDKSSEDDIDCLRIQVTAPQKQWLRIRRISIWVKKE
ncbi:alpha-1,3-mannosyl-glycoprotein 4-beta-N-acetylglucosaminyltransferase C [Pogona vitticeps]